jgi:hypothetical protein
MPSIAEQYIFLIKEAKSRIFKGCEMAAYDPKHQSRVQSTGEKKAIEQWKALESRL